MNFDLNLSALTTNALVVVPIIIAIVQAIKLTGWVQDHFSPLLAIGVGILIAWLGNSHATTLGSTILTGAVYGLMSSGLYSGVKTTMVAHSRMKAQREREKPLHSNKNRGNDK